MPVGVAVFASGSGSNLQALLAAQQMDPDCPFEIRLVVSDKPDCLAVQRALTAGVATWAKTPRTFADKAAYEAAIVTELRVHDIAWIALAGYMRLVGSTLLAAYADRIINIHPSLLPRYPGKQAVVDALADGATETGVTIHFVDAGIDTGPIIAQTRIAIQIDDTVETLLERVHTAEHRLYPQVLSDLVNERRA